MNPPVTQLDSAIELQKRLEQQAFIAELAQKALASQDFQHFLDEAARRVAEALNADCCEILQYEPDSQSFFFRSGHGWQDIYPGKARFNVETDTQFDLMNSLTGPILVNDFENENRFSGPIWLREHECRSGIIVLIKRNAEPIGVLGVYSRQSDYFSETYFDFLNSIASIIGAHFKNHQIVNEYKLLTEDLEKRVAQRAALVHLIHEVTSAANQAASVHDAIRIVLRKVCDYTGWPVGHAYLPDDKQPRELVDTPLWHLAEPGRYDGVRAATQQAHYPLGLGLPGRVFVSHMPAWRTNLADSESHWRDAAVQAGLQSVFALPVLVQDDSVAVLEFFSLSNERPEKDLMAALSNLGLQLGRVVERRRAEEKILESQQRLAEAQRIAKLGSWERDLRTDYAYWSDELYELYGVSPGTFDGSFNAFLNLVHPDDKPEFVRRLENTFQNPGPFQLNFRIIRPDGRERAMIAVGNIFADERGEPVRMVGTVQDVTERVEVDWKLRTQDEMLRNVVSSAPIVLWAVDRKGRVTFAEREGLAALGVRGGATIGANIFEQTQISPQICEYVRRALKGQDSEIDVKQGDRFFDAHFSAVRNERGDVIGASGIALDITERIDAEEALRASDRRFRQVIEGVKDYAIFTLSPEGLITSWNPGAERTAGYLAEEVLGRHFSIFYPEEAQEKDLPSLFLRRAKEEGRFEEEGWRTGKDERRFWAEVLITAIYDENGDLTGYSKIVRDISARRQAEQALRSSEARFRSIFESSAMGIALINLDGRFLITNPVIEAIFDYTSAEFLNQTLGDLAFRKDAVNIQGLLSELAAGKRDLFRSEGRFRRADGRIIWSNLTVSLVRDGEGRPHYAVCMIEDITFRKRMEAELNEIKRQLIAARERERLHLAQELHDSPMQELYGVMFQIEALNGEIEDDETQEELEIMRQGVEGVVDNLRAICGDLRPPALAPFGLEGALREHLDKFEADHPNLTLHIELTYDGQLLPEELRLILFRIYQQAMANIARHAEADNVYIRFYYTDERVFLEIEDDGRGFEVPMRWVSFTRQNHLGLAGAAERAELAGGKMNVKSSPGQGTLIYVELPLRQETDPSLE